MIDYTDFELRGKPLREWLIEKRKVVELGWYLTHEPEHEVVTAFERKLAYVNALPEERWALFPEEEIGYVLDPFVHAGKWGEIDPWIEWFNSYLPKAVPVPEGFEFRWLEDYEDRAEWCELSYLSPWERLGLNRHKSLWTVKRDSRPIDSYGSPPGSIKSDSPGFEQTPYLQVGFWPDKGEFQTLDRGGQSWYAKATGLVQMPRVHGEIAMRLCNWTVDGTGRKQDGEWSKRQRLGKGYPNEGRKHLKMWTLTEYSDTHPEWDERRRWVPADTGVCETATLPLGDAVAAVAAPPPPPPTRPISPA